MSVYIINKIIVRTAYRHYIKYGAPLPLVPGFDPVFRENFSNMRGDWVEIGLSPASGPNMPLGRETGNG